MNLQTMTIIFVIIFLPIILISTYYIQLEVDTINMQASFDTKLIDATTDAISAFEINTANEDLSSVSDSLRSIIEASNNVFITTLATNMGMSSASKSKILPYIPAVVYTLYDGYYIYAPTQSPKVVTDSNGVYVRVGDEGIRDAQDGKGTFYYDKEDVEKNNIFNSPTYEEEDYGKILYYKTKTIDGNNIECTTNPDLAYFTTKYMFKSFTPYSMRYDTSKYDITINYTLDNFITISGTTKNDETYYTKSGYLINTNAITEINIEMNGETYNIKSFDSDINTGGRDFGLDEIDDLIDNASYWSITIDGLTFTSDDLTAKSTYFTGEEMNDTVSAMKYYVKAYNFSKWVLLNFGDLKETNAKTEAIDFDGFKIKQSYEDFSSNIEMFYPYTENKIFEKKDVSNLKKDNLNNNEKNVTDLGEEDSYFLEHKRRVIKNSIQYNLNLAMKIYNAGQGDEYYQMPILSEMEWEKLLSNVSVLAFMQGLPCGMKTYSNYAIITSKNNELMANEDEIYYVPIYNGKDKIVYYNGTEGIDFAEEADGVMTSKHISDGWIPEYSSESNMKVDLNTAHRIDCKHLSLSKEYSSVTSSDQTANVQYFQSFPSREVKYDKVWDSDKKEYVYDHLVKSCYYCIVNSNYDETDRDDLDDILIKAELIAIAKIRNNTYKSCAFSKNYGIYFDNTANPELILEKLKKSYEVEITISNAMDSYNSSKYIKTDQVSLGGESKTYSVTTNNTQVLYFSDSNNLNDLLDPKLKTATGTPLKIVSILYKYK